MTTLIVVGLYLLALLGLGALSKRSFRGTSQDYFVASRSIGPFLPRPRAAGCVGEQAQNKNANPTRNSFTVRTVRLFNGHALSRVVPSMTICDDDVRRCL